MDWILCVALTVIANSSCIYIDNYVSDYYFKGRLAVSQKYFHAFAYSIVGIICVLASGADFASASFQFYLVFILAGLCSAASGIPYYKSLELSNSTDFGIFIQLSPIIYLILGWLFLGQSITPIQAIAFVILLLAPILVIATTKKRSREIKIKAAFYAFLNVLLTASSAIIFVQQNTGDVNFITEIGFVFIGKGLGNCLIMALAPKWRKRYHYVAKSSHQKVLLPLTASAISSIVRDFATNLAMILAPSVALVSAISDSSKPIVIFFMGLVLTLIWPKFGREKLDKHTVLVHLVATVLVVIGICLIQFS